MKKLINSVILGVVAINVHAQDLSTEITVDRTVLPEQRTAQRPALMPSLLSTPFTQIQLTAAEYEQQGTIVNSLCGLMPVPWRASVEKDPYRGYASVGYFPSFNLGASVGYRLIDTDKSSIAVMGQYNGNQYKRDDVKMRNNFANVRAKGHYWIDSKSLITGELGYDFTSVLHPGTLKYDYKDFTQKNNRFNVLVGWDSQINKVAYNLGVAYKYCMLDSYAPYINALNDWERLSSPHPHQSLFEMKAGVGLTRNQVAIEVLERWVGLDIDGCWSSANGGQGSLGEMHLDPYFRGSLGDFTARIGAKFSVATGDFDTGLRVAPNVRADYVSQSIPVAAWLEAGGGEWLNTYSDLFMLNPYFAPTQRLGRTNMPISCGLGVNIGSIKGFTLSLYGRYASVRNWYAPVSEISRIVMDDAGNGTGMRYVQPIFDAQDANTWLVGGKISYQYRSLLSIECSFEKTGSNHDYASWWQWMDRAETQVGALLKVVPMSQLDIECGYTLRASRHGYAYLQGVYDLGDMHNLWIGGNYRVNSVFSIWLRAENLTNSEYRLISGYQAQGIKGLVGVSLKF